MDVDTAIDICCILGMAASGLVASGLSIAPLVAASWCLYLSLYTLGGTFLSFQWDILLLEVGFLAIWWAPVLFPGCATPVAASSMGSSVAVEQHPEPPSRAVQWVIRFLFFKLMFMSGVVKASTRTTLIKAPLPQIWTAVN